MTAPPRRCHECGSAIPTDQAVPDAETHGDDARASVVGGIPSAAPAPSAEPPAQAATDVVDECERLFWSFKALGDQTQTQTPLSDRDAFKRTVRPILLAATYAINKELRATVERQAREIARWNELHRVIAEELDCDTETWPDHRNAPLAIGVTFVLIKQRAERAEAERDALRECVRELVACADESDSLAAERLYGKPHTPEYKTRELDHRQRSIEAWKAARAKVKETK